MRHACDRPAHEPLRIPRIALPKMIPAIISSHARRRSLIRLESYCVRIEMRPKSYFLYRRPMDLLPPAAASYG